MAKEAKKTKETKKKISSDQKDDIKRLYKSQYDRMIGGVAGGIAEYLKVDTTIVRIVFVLMSLFGGTGLIIYIAGLLIMPESKLKIRSEKSAKIKRNNTGFWGVLLIIAGLFFILPDMGFMRSRHMWMWHDFWGFLLPIMVIAIGAWLLLRPASPESTLLSKSKKTKDDKEENETDTRRKLTRSIVDKKISGVCGGIGEYFNIDSTIVRILWVIATLASGGFGILAYLIFIITISVSENSIEGGE